MYLDPGSGSYILQILLAGLLGGFFIIKTNWLKIRSMFSKKNSDQKDDTGNGQQ
jgi:hypothetical protein